MCARIQIGALETAIADLSTSPSTSSAAGAGHLAHVGVTVMNSAAPGQMHTRFAEAKQRNKERGGSATTKVAFFSNPFLAEQPEPEVSDMLYWLSHLFSSSSSSCPSCM